MAVTKTEDVRESNERIADRAERFHFVSRVPMLCECASPECQQIFLIGLDRYHELRPGGALAAP